METSSDADFVLWNKFSNCCGINLSKVSNAELAGSEQEVDLKTFHHKRLVNQQNNLTSALNRSELLLSGSQGSWD